MHIVIGGATDLLGLVHHRGLGFGQLDLGCREPVLGPGADFGDLVTGLARRGTQQFFAVCNHQLDVGNQFVFGNFGHFSHGLLLKIKRYKSNVTDSSAQPP